MDQGNNSAALPQSLQIDGHVDSPGLINTTVTTTTEHDVYGNSEVVTTTRVTTTVHEVLEEAHSLEKSGSTHSFTSISEDEEWFVSEVSEDQSNWSVSEATKLNDGIHLHHQHNERMGQVSVLKTTYETVEYSESTSYAADETLTRSDLDESSQSERTFSEALQHTSLLVDETSFNSSTPEKLETRMTEQNEEDEGSQEPSQASVPGVDQELTNLEPNVVEVAEITVNPGVTNASIEHQDVIPKKLYASIVKAGANQQPDQSFSVTTMEYKVDSKSSPPLELEKVQSTEQEENINLGGQSDTNNYTSFSGMEIDEELATGQFGNEQDSSSFNIKTYNEEAINDEHSTEKLYSDPKQSNKSEESDTQIDSILESLNENAAKDTEQQQDKGMEDEELLDANHAVAMEVNTFQTKAVQMVPANEVMEQTGDRIDAEDLEHQKHIDENVINPYETTGKQRFLETSIEKDAMLPDTRPEVAIEANTFKQKASEMVQANKVKDKIVQQIAADEIRELSAQEIDVEEDTKLLSARHEVIMEANTYKQKASEMVQANEVQDKIVEQIVEDENREHSAQEIEGDTKLLAACNEVVLEANTIQAKASEMVQANEVKDKTGEQIAAGENREHSASEIDIEEDTKLLAACNEVVLEANTLQAKASEMVQANVVKDKTFEQIAADQNQEHSAPKIDVEEDTKLLDACHEVVLEAKASEMVQVKEVTDKTGEQIAAEENGKHKSHGDNNDMSPQEVTETQSAPEIGTEKDTRLLDSCHEVVKEPNTIQAKAVQMMQGSEIEDKTGVGKGADNSLQHENYGDENVMSSQRATEKRGAQETVLEKDMTLLDACTEVVMESSILQAKAIQMIQANDNEDITADHTGAAENLKQEIVSKESTMIPQNATEIQSAQEIYDEKDVCDEVVMEANTLQTKAVQIMQVPEAKYKIGDQLDSADISSETDVPSNEDNDSKRGDIQIEDEDMVDIKVATKVNVHSDNQCLVEPKSDSDYLIMSDNEPIEAKDKIGDQLDAADISSETDVPLNEDNDAKRGDIQIEDENMVDIKVATKINVNSDNQCLVEEQKADSDYLIIGDNEPIENDKYIETRTENAESSFKMNCETAREDYPRSFKERFRISEATERRALDTRKPIYILVLKLCDEESSSSDIKEMVKKYLKREGEDETEVLKEKLAIRGSAKAFGTWHKPKQAVQICPGYHALVINNEIPKSSQYKWLDMSALEIVGNQDPTTGFIYEPAPFVDRVCEFKPCNPGSELAIVSNKWGDYSYTINYWSLSDWDIEALTKLNTAYSLESPSSQENEFRWSEDELEESLPPLNEGVEEHATGNKDYENVDKELKTPDTDIPLHHKREGVENNPVIPSKKLRLDDVVHRDQQSKETENNALPKASEMPSQTDADDMMATKLQESLLQFLNIPATTEPKGHSDLKTQETDELPAELMASDENFDKFERDVFQTRQADLGKRDSILSRKNYKPSQTEEAQFMTIDEGVIPSGPKAETLLDKALGFFNIPGDKELDPLPQDVVLEDRSTNKQQIQQNTTTKIQQHHQKYEETMFSTRTTRTDEKITKMLLKTSTEHKDRESTNLGDQKRVDLMHLFHTPEKELDVTDLFPKSSKGREEEDSEIGQKQQDTKKSDGEWDDLYNDKGTSPDVGEKINAFFRPRTSFSDPHVVNNEEQATSETRLKGAENDYVEANHNEKHLEAIENSTPLRTIDTNGEPSLGENITQFFQANNQTGDGDQIETKRDDILETAKNDDITDTRDTTAQQGDSENDDESSFVDKITAFFKVNANKILADEEPGPKSDDSHEKQHSETYDAESKLTTSNDRETQEKSNDLPSDASANEEDPGITHKLKSFLNIPEQKTIVNKDLDQDEREPAKATQKDMHNLQTSGSKLETFFNLPPNAGEGSEEKPMTEKQHSETYDAESKLTTSENRETQEKINDLQSDVSADDVDPGITHKLKSFRNITEQKTTENKDLDQDDREPAKVTQKDMHNLQTSGSKLETFFNLSPNACEGSEEEPMTEVFIESNKEKAGFFRDAKGTGRVDERTRQIASTEGSASGKEMVRGHQNENLLQKVGDLGDALQSKRKSVSGEDDSVNVEPNVQPYTTVDIANSEQYRARKSQTASDKELKPEEDDISTLERQDNLDDNVQDSPSYFDKYVAKATTDTKPEVDAGQPDDHIDSDEENQCTESEKTEEIPADAGPSSQSEEVTLGQKIKDFFTPAHKSKEEKGEPNIDAGSKPEKHIEGGNIDTQQKVDEVKQDKMVNQESETKDATLDTKPDIDAGQLDDHMDSEDENKCDESEKTEEISADAELSFSSENMTLGQKIRDFFTPARKSNKQKVENIIDSGSQPNKNVDETDIDKQQKGQKVAQHETVIEGTDCKGEDLDENKTTSKVIIETNAGKTGPSYENKVNESVNERTEQIASTERSTSDTEMVRGHQKENFLQKVGDLVNVLQSERRSVSGEDGSVNAEPNVQQNTTVNMSNTEQYGACDPEISSQREPKPEEDDASTLERQINVDDIDSDSSNNFVKYVAREVLETKQEVDARQSDDHIGSEDEKDCTEPEKTKESHADVEQAYPSEEVTLGQKIRDFFTPARKSTEEKGEHNTDTGSKPDETADGTDIDNKQTVNELIQDEMMNEGTGYKDENLSKIKTASDDFIESKGVKTGSYDWTKDTAEPTLVDKEMVGSHQKEEFLQTEEDLVHVFQSESKSVSGEDDSINIESNVQQYTTVQISNTEQYRVHTPQSSSDKETQHEEENTTILERQVVLNVDAQDSPSYFDKYVVRARLDTKPEVDSRQHDDHIDSDEENQCAEPEKTEDIPADAEPSSPSEKVTLGQKIKDFFTPARKAKEEKGEPNIDAGSKPDKNVDGNNIDTQQNVDEVKQDEMVNQGLETKEEIPGANETYSDDLTLGEKIRDFFTPAGKKMDQKTEIREDLSPEKDDNPTNKAIYENDTTDSRVPQEVNREVAGNENVCEETESKDEQLSSGESESEDVTFGQKFRDFFTPARKSQNQKDKSVDGTASDEEDVSRIKSSTYVNSDASPQQEEDPEKSNIEKVHEEKDNTDTTVAKDDTPYEDVTFGQKFLDFFTPNRKTNDEEKKGEDDFSPDTENVSMDKSNQEDTELETNTQEKDDHDITNQENESDETERKDEKTLGEKMKNLFSPDRKPNRDKSEIGNDSKQVEKEIISLEKEIQRINESKESAIVRNETATTVPLHNRFLSFFNIPLSNNTTEPDSGISDESRTTTEVPKQQAEPHEQTTGKYIITDPEVLEDGRRESENTQQYTETSDESGFKADESVMPPSHDISPTCSEDLKDDGNQDDTLQWSESSHKADGNFKPASHDTSPTCSEYLKEDGIQDDTLQRSTDSEKAGKSNQSKIPLPMKPIATENNEEPKITKSATKTMSLTDQAKEAPIESSELGLDPVPHNMVEETSSLNVTGIVINDPNGISEEIVRSEKTESFQTQSRIPISTNKTQIKEEKMIKSQTIQIKTSRIPVVKSALPENKMDKETAEVKSTSESNTPNVDRNDPVNMENMVDTNGNVATDQTEQSTETTQTEIMVNGNEAESFTEKTLTTENEESKETERNEETDFTEKTLATDNEESKEIERNEDETNAEHENSQQNNARADPPVNLDDLTNKEQELPTTSKTSFLGNIFQRLSKPTQPGIDSGDNKADEGQWTILTDEKSGEQDKPHYSYEKLPQTDTLPDSALDFWRIFFNIPVKPEPISPMTTEDHTIERTSM